MPTHRIHLRGPWEYEWLSEPINSGGSLESEVRPDRSGRVIMPADWESLFGAAAGRAVFRRRFHRPTNLGPDERVFIVFDSVGGTGDVTVNQTWIGRVHSSSRQQRFETTGALEAFNELAVELEFDPRTGAPQTGGLYAPTAIEIESLS